MVTNSHILLYKISMLIYVPADISIFGALICFLRKIMCDYTFTNVILKHAHTNIYIQTIGVSLCIWITVLTKN